MNQWSLRKVLLTSLLMSACSSPPETIAPPRPSIQPTSSVSPTPTASVPSPSASPSVIVSPQPSPPPVATPVSPEPSPVIQGTLVLKLDETSLSGWTRRQVAGRQFTLNIRAMGENPQFERQIPFTLGQVIQVNQVPTQTELQVSAFEEMDWLFRTTPCDSDFVKLSLNTSLRVTQAFEVQNITISPLIKPGSGLAIVCYKPGLSGQVFRSDGTPLPDAEIKVTYGMNSVTLDHVSQTQLNGEYRIPDVYAGVVIFVEASAPGYITQTQRVVLKENRTNQPDVNRVDFGGANAPAFAMQPK